MKFDPVAFGVFLAVTVLVTGIGFFANRWRRPKNADNLDEWALGGRTLGPFITWFLLDGDLYSAHTLIATPLPPWQPRPRPPSAEIPPSPPTLRS